MDRRGKVCALRASKPDQEAVGRDSGGRNPKTGVAGKKMRMISQTLDMGGAHVVTIGNIPSLERFQVHPNGKSRLIVVPSGRAHERPFACADEGD